MARAGPGVAAGGAWSRRRWRPLAPAALAPGAPATGLALEVVPAPAPAVLVAAAPPPPVDALARAGTLHLLVPGADGVARCEAWAVEPDAATAGAGRLVLRWQTGAASSELSYANYATAGARLVLSSPFRKTTTGRGDDAEGDGEASTCEVERTVRAVGHHLEVDGAWWFDDAAGCEAARAAHAPVATDLSACEVGRAAVADAVVARGRARLARLLRRGGALWAIAEATDGTLACDAVTVTGGDVAGGVHRASVSRATRRDDGAPGTEGWDLEWDGAARVTVLGPGWEWREPDGSVTTGGLGCMEEATLTIVAADAFDLGDRWYLDRAACRRAVAVARTRRGWLPPVADDAAEADDADDAAVATLAPAMPGC
ncbi:MAG: hypothetical protein H6708_06105 [Kofleriaceae bacterium]|nr:hypothetical protein [Kofleriaceae bacterium]